MCGITGFLSASPTPDANSIVTKMRETLKYRGPDEHGVYLDGPLAFGHSRLIVVDPAGGKQPMTKTYKGETYTIISNAELYNTEEVRAKLLEKGHTFASYSDTEVFLTAFIEWGEHAVDHLTGIFGLAVWASNAKTLYLVRDHLGVKPLYYSYLPDSDTFVFGSEIKAILQHPKIEPVITINEVRYLFSAALRRSDETQFRGISIVKPGHIVEVKLENNKLHKREWQYWTVKAVPHTDDSAQTGAKVQSLLRAAVERQLVSDVPLGSLLSGGIDSSSIAVLAFQKQTEQGKPFRTFSVDFKDSEKHFKSNWIFKDLDGPYVKLLAERFQLNHLDCIVDNATQVNYYLETMRAKDKPSSASMDASLLYLFHRVKENVVVALSGECSDELFGGYVWFHDVKLRENLNSLMTQSFNTGLIQLFRDEIFSDLNLLKYTNDTFQEVFNSAPVLEGESPLDAQLRAITYVHIYGFMQMLLERKDSISMRSSLEVRVPFADHHLVQYVYNIPWSLRAEDGVVKCALKNAMRGILPDEIINRAKTPYPLSQDPELVNLSMGLLEESIKDGSPIFQIFDEKKVKSFIAKTKEGATEKETFGPHVFAFLVQFHFWMVEYGIKFER